MVVRITIYVIDSMNSLYLIQLIHYIYIYIYIRTTGKLLTNISIGIVFIGIVNFSLIGSAVSEKGYGSGICLAQNHLRTTGKLPTKFHLNRSSIYRCISIVNFSSIGSAVSEKGDGSGNFLA